MRKVLQIAGLVTCFAFFISCKKSNNTGDPTPVISYKSFSAESNELDAYLTINFSDNDGDMGLNPGDTTGLYAPNTAGYYDAYIQYYYKDTTTGAFVKPYIHDPISGKIDSSLYTYRMPFVENNRKDKALTGEIVIHLVGFRPGDIKPYDHFRFDIYIYDRALHKSNLITTPEIYQP